MSLKGQTLVKGHTLLYEGKALKGSRWSGGEGIGKCSCGLQSEELPSTAARQRWHKQHKEEIKAAMAAQEQAK